MKQERNIAIFFCLIVLFTSFIEIKAEEESESKISLRPGVEYKAEGLRDPFQDYLKKEEEASKDKYLPEAVSLTPPSLTVQGIIWGSDIPRAIINNKVVKAGDTIEESRVIKIEKDGIEISYKGQPYHLASPAKSRLKQESQKTEKTKTEEVRYEEQF